MYNQDPNNPNSRSEIDLRRASHDLNNLLHNIITGIDLLKEKTRKSDSIIKIFNNIENNTSLAVEILNQLYNSSSHLSNQKSVIDLKKIILESVEIVGKDRKNLIVLEGINREQLTWGNYTDIKRVFINLIKNAREAAENSSVITIKLDSVINNNKNFVQVIVSDNGRGISKEDVNRLFDDGFSTKSSSLQRGVGLSIVKSIMDDHGAIISVKSSSKQGTSFELFFQSYTFDSGKSRLENKKVMIAEDDEFQREVLKDLLKSLKLNVFTASHGIEARELYTSTKPDLFFIDDNMPGMSGIECTEKIKELNNASPIVLVTGSKLGEEYLGKNISKVLRKPYSFDMIESTIKELL